MVVTSSARKGLRVSARKRVFNLRRVRTMRGAIKDTVTEAKSGGKATQEKFRIAQKAIDKARKRGIIKKNTAARKKSRLSKAVRV